ncbi:MAG: type IV pili methyl-accepting chemotaxis transducer N-terminal domain-containing protein, partial [Rubrivivax sp.]|nr:type IV pili methyl-accepting chemotaxis transducer N-terminal domain-containing protein [Rubrivivax sp.]
MSFLDRIKGAGRAKPEADIPLPSTPFDELAAPMSPTEVTVRLGQGSTAGGGRDDADSSIISEAAPSELAQEFSETRMAGANTESEGFTSGLPIIGAWPLARQQRALLITAGVGLAGILLTVVLVLVSSSSGSRQVAAAGQATTQSQRLAKSVSQALVGSAAAFPEVKDSIDVLAANVRSLKTGEGNVPAAPLALQEEL